MESTTETTAAEIFTSGTDHEKYDYLAGLELAHYDRIRESIAKSMGIRVSTLDVEVSKRHSTEKPKALALSDPEPRVESVSGHELLDALEREIATYVAISEPARIAVTIWIVLTFLVDAVSILPLLLITSPQKRCGKSTLLILLNRLCRRPLLASNISPAALFRVVEAYKPTLLLDEADAWAHDNEELRGIINAGHCRDTAGVMRVDGEQLEPRLFDTFCPKVIAGIGNLADTIHDRAVIVAMQRRGPNETVRPLRQDKLDLDYLRSMARRWADDHLLAFRDTDPCVPVELHDRAADNWRPLLHIADLAGGSWAERARRAALALTANAADDDDIRSQLLEDIRDLFKERGDRIASADMVQYLAAMETRPWGEWKHGKPVSQVQLARMLKPFGLSTFNVRDGGRVYKAYGRAGFQDAFERYLKSPELPATSLPRPDLLQRHADRSATAPQLVAARSATDSGEVAGQYAIEPVNTRGSSGVAAQASETGVLEI